MVGCPLAYPASYILDPPAAKTVSIELVGAINIEQLKIVDSRMVSDCQGTDLMRQRKDVASAWEVGVGGPEYVGWPHKRQSSIRASRFVYDGNQVFIDAGGLEGMLGQKIRLSTRERYVEMGPWSTNREWAQAEGADRHTPQISPIR